eukprot:TRINITY_DN7289_c1_g1_i4.p3 TRINITY_DN7289_c1_g1~~TRINITY_DN7289_c1_g1_i4.p3  ORF type:complete len:184 (-),score=25.37 TRINITY_DN7289_c1_g1_i4:323-874(-)
MITALQRSCKPCLQHVINWSQFVLKRDFVVRPWEEGMILLAMPRLSQSMEQGSIVTWLKNEGDLVKEHEILLEVKTSSLTQDAQKVGKFEGDVLMEIESAEEAYLAKILVPAGSESLKVGTPIAVLCDSERMLKKAAQFDPPESLNVYDNEMEMRMFTWQAFLKAPNERGMRKVQKVLDEFKK